MERYEELHQRLVSKTITLDEMHELQRLAFGSEYMNSNDKGAIKEY
jgi:hypothetical protein